MDPIQQILAQGQMGDKNGGLQQYYFEGQRAGQQQQQINLSKQRLLLEQRQQDNADAIAPYKAEAERLSNINTGIAIKADTMKLQALTQQNEALPELLNLQLQFAEHPEGFANLDLSQKVQGLTQKFPMAFQPGTQGATLISNMKAAPMLSADVARIIKANELVKAANPDLYVSGFDEKGNIKISRDAAKQPLAATQEIESLMNAAAANDAAQGITKTPAELAQRRLDFTQDKVLPMGSTETIKTPDGTEVTRQVGRQYKDGAKSGVPAAITTDATKKITAIQDTVSQIASIKNTLRPEDVGVKGYVADKLFDTLAPAFGLNTGNATRMDNREKIGALFESAKTIVNSDKRFSTADREDTKKIFPGTGPLDNFEKNVVMMSALERIQGKRALIEASNAKMPAPDFAVRLLNQQGITDAFDAGLMTGKEVMSELKRRKAIQEATQ